MTKPRNRNAVREIVLDLLDSGPVTKRACVTATGRSDDYIGQVLRALEAEGLAQRVGTCPAPVRCRHDHSRIVHYVDAVLWAASDGRMSPAYRAKAADRVVRSALQATAHLPAWLGGRMGAESRAS